MGFMVMYVVGVLMVRSVVVRRWMSGSRVGVCRVVRVSRVFSWGSRRVRFPVRYTVRSLRSWSVYM